MCQGGDFTKNDGTGGNNLYKSFWFFQNTRLKTTFSLTIFFNFLYFYLNGSCCADIFVSRKINIRKKV